MVSGPWQWLRSCEVKFIGLCCIALEIRKKKQQDRLFYKMGMAFHAWSKSMGQMYILLIGYTVRRVSIGCKNSATRWKLSVAVFSMWARDWLHNQLAFCFLPCVGLTIYVQWGADLVFRNFPVSAIKKRWMPVMVAIHCVIKRNDRCPIGQKRSNCTSINEWVSDSDGFWVDRLWWKNFNRTESINGAFIFFNEIVFINVSL